MNASEALFEARKQGSSFTVNGKGQVKVSAYCRCLSRCWSSCGSIGRS
jgi:hypothetical protein